MRIVFFHIPSDYYGASRSLIRLTRKLKHDGHDVFVILAEEGTLTNLLLENGITVVIHASLSYYSRKRVKNFFSFLSFIFSIPFSVSYIIKFARKHKITIFHTNVTLIISPGIAAKLAGIKHYWHIRESFAEFGDLWKLYKWFIYFFATKIICVSNPIADQFQNKKIRKKIHVLYNGFPKEEFATMKDMDIEMFKNKYRISDEITIGVLGRIKLRRKGQDVFLRAAAILITKFNNLRFFIIGSPFPGNENQAVMLNDLIDNLELNKYTILTGDIPDTHPAYCALDIVVLPSVNPEPFGGVVIEAMAFGKPVVGTRIGGTLEQIEDNVTGFLVQPDDPTDLADALEKLIVDKKLREEFGHSAKKRFLENFEFEQFYRKILAIYTS